MKYSTKKNISQDNFLQKQTNFSHYKININEIIEILNRNSFLIRAIRASKLCMRPKVDGNK